MISIADPAVDGLAGIDRETPLARHHQQQTNDLSTAMMRGTDRLDMTPSTAAVFGRYSWPEIRGSAA